MEQGSRLAKAVSKRARVPESKETERTAETKAGSQRSVCFIPLASIKFWKTGLFCKINLSFSHYYIKNDLHENIYPKVGMVFFISAYVLYKALGEN